MTAMGRPALELIPGGLSIVPNTSLSTSPSESEYSQRRCRNAARSVPRIVAAAQQWATLMIATGHADQLTLADSNLTELGRATLALLDSVDEYEAHSAGSFTPDEQGPAATLW